MSSKATVCTLISMTLLLLLCRPTRRDVFASEELTQEPWYFVHITDPHCYLPQEHWDNWSASPSLSRWYSDIQQIASFDPPPAFVLCTGDLVEFGAGWPWGEMNYAGMLAAFYGDRDAQEYYVNETMTIPMYFCPGNHDAKQLTMLPSSFDNYHRIVKDANYYKVVGDNYAIFSLNSGSDVINDAHWLTPEGDGLYYDDLQSLRSDLAYLDDSYCKIVMMHHPFVNPEGEFIGQPWNDWVDGVFLNYRGEFIQACEEYGVDMIVFGHVHDGRDGGPFTHGGVWDRYGGGWKEDNGTRFVITNAIKSSNAYRKIWISPRGEIEIGDVEHFQDQGGPGTVPQFRVYQNYPNPFNTFTNISFCIPNASDVKLEIYNVLGQRVNTLVEGRREAGEHIIEWNSRGSDGQPVAPGVYFYHLTADGLTEAKKMLLLK